DKSRIKFLPRFACPRPPSQGRASAAVTVRTETTSNKQAMGTNKLVRRDALMAFISTSDCPTTRIYLFSGSNPRSLHLTQIQVPPITILSDQRILLKVPT